MPLQSRVSGRLAQLRAAGQLLVAPRPWPGPSAGAARTRSSACGPPAPLGAYGPRARTSAGVGAWGAAAVGRRAGVRTWAPLAMAAKVDLSTSTDWKEAKSFLKGLSDKQREEHYFCKDFVRLKKIPTWKETAKGVAVKVEEPKYKKDKQLNEKISLFRGDITKLEVDAIVNAGSGLDRKDRVLGPWLRGQLCVPMGWHCLGAQPCQSLATMQAASSWYLLAELQSGQREVGRLMSSVPAQGRAAFAEFLWGRPSCACLGLCFLLCTVGMANTHRSGCWGPQEPGPRK
nr:O-acetyl-ADP-ribose deacetylase MACROD1 isoform X5 [Microcebus murinus]